MISNSSLSEMGNLLRSAESIVLFPHESPDGDALGSCAALCRALRNEGKDAWAVSYTHLDVYKRQDEYMEDDIEYVDDEDGIEYIDDDEDEIEYIDDEDDQDMNEEITEIPEDIEDMEDIGDDGEITETAEDRGDEIED